MLLCTRVLVGAFVSSDGFLQMLIFVSMLYIDFLLFIDMAIQVVWEGGGVVYHDSDGRFCRSCLSSDITLWFK